MERGQAAPHTVWIVYVEFEEGTPDILGAFRDEQLARDEADISADGYRELGMIVEGDDTNDHDWDVSIYVDEHEVQ